MLQERFKGYRNLDGAKQKQKASPMSAIRKIMEVVITDKDLAIAWLLTGAIFFAMRSCEYLRTGREEVSKRTKIIRLKNIIFKKEGTTIDHRSESINEAYILAITFAFQKNDRRTKKSICLGQVTRCYAQ